MDPNAKDTQSIARNHVIEVSDSKLVTIAGGEAVHIGSHLMPPSQLMYLHACGRQVDNVSLHVQGHSGQGGGGGGF